MGWFNWNSTYITGGTSPHEELPEIFPISMSQVDFVRVDVITIYQKILTDVLERTHGLSEDQAAMLWDNCVQSESALGLISLLARAMADKSDLFIVYEAAVGVVREATGEEKEKIREDYKKMNESSLGIFISFRHHMKSDMIILYSALEYVTVSSLNKTMNLSKAIQVKVNDLRGSVSLTDSSVAIAQAKNMATSLGCGKDILMDAKDTIETGTPDLTAIQSAIEFLDSKRSFYLGLPSSYINGEQTGGLGTTGENDTKAIERGLKNYFHSVMKPVLETIFDVTVTYKSQDFRNILSSMEVLKTFSLVDAELISVENKLKIVNQLLDLPEDAEGDPVKAQAGPEQVPGVSPSVPAKAVV